MKNAYDPEVNRKITVQDYIREYGNGRVEEWQRARCPICKQRLAVVGASSVDSIGHFAHQRNSGFCPTKAKSAIPYSGLLPRNPDPESARRIKAIFRENWERHFIRLNQLVKGLSVEEFLELIETANQERIWEYTQLEEFQLPYVFVTLMDFPPHKSFKDKDGNHKRKYWFRFWFDETVKRYDDLWINRDNPLSFWRAWYQVPDGLRRRPQLGDMIDCYGCELSRDFLNSEMRPFPFVVKRVEAWLGYNFSIS